MTKYLVTITETTSATFAVEANSDNEAMAIVESAYESGEIDMIDYGPELDYEARTTGEEEWEQYNEL